MPSEAGLVGFMKRVEVPEPLEGNSTEPGKGTSDGLSEDLKRGI